MGLITEKTPLAGVQPVKFLLNWGRRYSLWVFNFGLACCSIEFIAASTSKHDFIRLGVIPFAHGPRQADDVVLVRLQVRPAQPAHLPRPVAADAYFSSTGMVRLRWPTSV